MLLYETNRRKSYGLSSSKRLTGRSKNYVIRTPSEGNTHEVKDN